MKKFISLYTYIKIYYIIIVNDIFNNKNINLNNRNDFLHNFQVYTILKKRQSNLDHNHYFHHPLFFSFSYLNEYWFPFLLLKYFHKF